MDGGLTAGAYAAVLAVLQHVSMAACAASHCDPVCAFATGYELKHEKAVDTIPAIFFLFPILLFSSDARYLAYDCRRKG